MKKYKIGLSCSFSNVYFSSTAWLVAFVCQHLHIIWDKYFQGVHTIVSDLRRSPEKTNKQTRRKNPPIVVLEKVVCIHIYLTSLGSVTSCNTEQFS